MSQLWQVPTFFLGIVALSLVAAKVHFRVDPALAEFDRELATLRQAVDDPGEKINRALLDKSGTLFAKAERYPARAAETSFLIGSLHARLSEEGLAEQKQANRAKAESYLESALAKGVAEADLPRLKARLGIVLYLQGQKPARAVEMLGQAVESGADVPDRAYEILIAAYLKQTPSETGKALEICNKQLERSGQSDEKLARARLAMAEVLLKVQRRHDALRELERIGNSAPKELRLKARYLQAHACETDGLWSRGVPLWKELVQSPDAVPGGKGHILYALGLCYRNGESSDPDLALDHWNRVLPLGGEEAQAAALRIGETRLMADPRLGLKSWSDALAQVHAPGDYSNAYIPLDKAREMFEAGCRYLIETQNFQASEQAAELYRRLAEPGKAELFLAQASETLARQILEKMPPGDATPWLIKAGQAYEQVAQLSSAQTQAEHFWHSAACFQSAKQNAQAIRNLEKFVTIEKDAGKLAESWLMLAEANLALRQKDRALEAYYKCIDYRDSPFACKARYQLAQMESERKHPDRAITILEETLRSSSPNMERETHEKVLYLLGDLLYQEKMFDKACVYLKEASRQYPTNAEALTSRSRLADSYRKLAKQEADRGQASLNEDSRRIFEQKRREWLEKALDNYQTLANDFEDRPANLPLSLDERKMQRHALFSVAEIHLERNEVPEAIQRYQVLQNRYGKQGEALIACHGIWLCYCRARGAGGSPENLMQIRQIMWAALKQAQAVLQEIPENSPTFSGARVFSKREWLSWTDYVQDELRKDDKMSP